MIKKSIKAFTLIELLVVISLIGVLSTLLIANLNSARERSRDVQRKSDLRNIQTALRLYYNDYGAYPETFALWGQPWTLGSTTYMNLVPAEPLSDRTYEYTDDSVNDAYVLTACLENKSDDKCDKDAGGEIIPCGVDDAGCLYSARP